MARLTVTSFDVEQAPSARGPFGFFLGDYECLTNIGTTFVPAFIAVNNESTANPTDVLERRSHSTWTQVGPVCA